MTPPPTAPSSDEDGGGRSLSVATSRAGLGGGEEGTSWTAPPSVDGVAIDRFGEGDEKSAQTTTQQRRQTSSSVVVPPLPLGKPEVVSSSALPPVSVRRKNSFVAKLVASWQFAQRKRLRRQDALDFLGYAILGLLSYATCYLLFGRTMLPGGQVWSVLVVWLAAQAGGALISFTGLHPLLGMLLAGVAAENIPVPWLTAPLPASWKSKIRQGALAIIFLRSGLELDWAVFRRAGPAALRLLLVPGIVEALVSGSVAHAVFGMPWLLAYALGFILKAVGPAIVIQLMFDLQKRGLGAAKGIPALVVAAASFDDLVAIFFYTLFINFAVQGATPVAGKAAAASEEGSSHSPSLALQLANGPISVLLGFAGGALLALVAAATRVWSTRRKRTAAVVVLALTYMYVMDHFHYDGAGALGALTLGVTSSVLWRSGRPRFISCGPGPAFARDVEHGVGSLWWWLAQPLLFGCIGTNLNFSKLGSASQWVRESCAVIFSGWLPRPFITALVVGGGSGAATALSAKERGFVGAAWLPKASVQAALASAPLDAIVSRGLSQEWVEWGQQIQLTAILAILICGTTGIVAVNVFAPLCLEKSPGVDVGSVIPTGGVPGGGGPSEGAAAAGTTAAAGAPAPSAPGGGGAAPPSPFAAAASSSALMASADEAEQAAAAAASVPPPPPPPPLPPPLTSRSRALEEQEAYELLRERESAFARYMEEADALAAFVEVADAGSEGANYAKRVRLDALAFRKNALRSYWTTVAPSALDLFRMDAIMRARLQADGAPGAAAAAALGAGPPAAATATSTGRRSFGDLLVPPRRRSFASAAAAAGASGGDGAPGPSAPAAGGVGFARRISRALLSRFTGEGGPPTGTTAATAAPSAGGEEAPTAPATTATAATAEDEEGGAGGEQQAQQLSSSDGGGGGGGGDQPRSGPPSEAASAPAGRRSGSRGEQQ